MAPLLLILLEEGAAAGAGAAAAGAGAAAAGEGAALGAGAAVGAGEGAALGAGGSTAVRAALDNPAVRTAGRVANNIPTFPGHATTDDAQRQVDSGTNARLTMLSALHRRKVVLLGDGTLGYCTAPGRSDDCLQAAIATLLQVPPSSVPAASLDRAAGADHDAMALTSWLSLTTWAACRDLRILYWQRPPFDTAERWIAVTHEQHGPFTAHSLVMRRDEILFDPAEGLKLPEGVELIEREREDIAYGLTFEPIT